MRKTNSSQPQNVQINITQNIIQNNNYGSNNVNVNSIGSDYGGSFNSFDSYQMTGQTKSLAVKSDDDVKLLEKAITKATTNDNKMNELKIGLIQSYITSKHAMGILKLFGQGYQGKAAVLIYNHISDKNNVSVAFEVISSWGYKEEALKALGLNVAQPVTDTSCFVNKTDNEAEGVEKRIKNATTNDRKILEVILGVVNSFVTCKQAASWVKQIGMSYQKQATIIIYPHLSDLNNLSLIFAVFNSPSYKTETMKELNLI